MANYQQLPSEVNINIVAGDGDRALEELAKAGVLISRAAAR